MINNGTAAKMKSWLEAESLTHATHTHTIENATHPVRCSVDWVGRQMSSCWHSKQRFKWLFCILIDLFSKLFINSNTQQKERACALIRNQAEANMNEKMSNYNVAISFWKSAI